MKLIVATNNQGKADEFAVLLRAHFESVQSLRQAGIGIEIEEDGETFAQNAAKKAEAVCKLTGFPTLADDSGLCVDGLDGAPGVYSARFAGHPCNDAANNAHLLQQMQNIPNRAAHFACVLALARPGHPTLLAHGQLHGTITIAPRGEQGFGYDALFEHNGRTLAQMQPHEKNALSHRARAVEDLLAKLSALD